MTFLKSNPLKLVRVLACLAVLVVGLVGATQGLKAAEKIATAMLMPCGLVWFLMTFLAIQSAARKQWEMGIVVLAMWTLYSVAGNGLVADGLARSLESLFANIHPLEEETMDYVIVLGGGGSEGANGRLQGNDRLILAAQLYHQGVARNLICTGTNIKAMTSTNLDPAAMSADILQHLGVPSEAIEQTPGRNTSEEMQALGLRFKDSSERVGLVTSAWHLPRALRLAQRHGFDPQPLPSDFIHEPSSGAWKWGEQIEKCIPSGEAFRDSARIAKEYLAMAVGR